MFQFLSKATRLLITLTILTGVIYPLAVTAISQGLFPYRANGSLILEDGQPIASELIGQLFTGPQYFWGRLSTTTPVPYNAAASSGSNYGPLHPALKNAAATRIASLRANGSASTSVPVDLVTASGSGLDPHISPAAAEFQVPRVAAARRLSEEAVRKLVRECTAGRQFGVLGEPRVNVLLLNIALDSRASTPRRRALTVP